MVYSRKSIIFAYLTHDECRKMRNLPIVTRSILWANVLVFLLDAVLQRSGISLSAICGLHYFSAPQFYFWQPFTYMFLHADFGHIFFNMFAVLMFAPLLEREWGAKRFLIYYLVCGVGAGLVQEAVWAMMYQPTLSTMAAQQAAYFSNRLVTIGASGAVFGILFAFGWLFPNVPLFIMFIPIPIRARVFVIIYAVIELFAGLGNMVGTVDNVAHFAHLGGMLFGWLLLLWWQRGGDGWGYRIRRGWRNLTHRFRKHPRLDSTADKDYSDYHYQKRV